MNKYDGTLWHAMARVGTQLHVLTRNGTRWQAIARVGTQWHTMARNSTRWQDFKIYHYIKQSFFLRFPYVLTDVVIDR